jgi:sugar lactone lactonase YvrE
VYRIAYELATGTMGRAEPFLDLRGETGVPDGAAMDEQGCYWCAVHGAAQLHRYDAAGTLMSRITLPVSQPTMCAFVGPDLDEMVVTSARENLTPEQLAREPHAGGIFRFRPGVRGLPRPCVVL